MSDEMFNKLTSFKTNLNMLFEVLCRDNAAARIAADNVMSSLDSIIPSRGESDESEEETPVTLTGLTVFYDDTTAVAIGTSLSDLNENVLAIYSDGTVSDSLVKGEDYELTGDLITGETNTITVAGKGVYSCLDSVTFTVTMDEWYLLQLTQDGDQNKLLLQEALDHHRKVKLTQGSYPLTPSVTVDSGTLDLNNSIITSTVEKADGGLIYLRGIDPTIQNGEIAGLYNTPDKSNAVVWENESLISLVPCAYTNARIDNVKLHNCWGYAICERGKPQYAWWKSKIDDVNMTCENGGGNYIGGTITKVDGGYEYESNPLDISKIPAVFRNVEAPYYRMCVHYAGYYRIVSDRKVVYTFTTNTGETMISEEVPGMAVAIPENTVSVSVKLFWADGNDTWRSYDYFSYWFFKDFEGGLTVNNCKTYHNSSLGMVGASLGKTVVTDCESWGNGTPYEGATAMRNTIGFIDIEDCPSPYVYLKNCYSHDEKHFALLGAYNINVENCEGADVVVHRGWQATVTNTEALVNTFSTNVKTPVTVTDCIMVGNAGTKMPENVTGTGCRLVNIKRQPGFTNSTYAYRTANIGFGSVTGVWNGTIEPQYSNVGYGISEFAPEDGSDVEIFANLGSTGAQWMGQLIRATGDCYGVRSNETVFPNGHTIYNSVFSPGPQKLFAQLWNKSVLSGTFDNCIFDLTDRAYAILGYNSTAKTSIQVTFRNCTIHNSENYLLGVHGNVTWGPGTVLTFENCVIDDESKICEKGTPTINIVRV